MKTVGVKNGLAAKQIRMRPSQKIKAFLLAAKKTLLSVKQIGLGRRVLRILQVLDQFNFLGIDRLLLDGPFTLSLPEQVFRFYFSNRETNEINEGRAHSKRLQQVRNINK